jgi:hypothetical protein
VNTIDLKTKEEDKLRHCTQIAIVVKSGGFLVEIGTSTFWAKKS